MCESACLKRNHSKNKKQKQELNDTSTHSTHNIENSIDHSTQHTENSTDHSTHRSQQTAHSAQQTAQTTVHRPQQTVHSPHSPHSPQPTPFGLLFARTAAQLPSCPATRRTWQSSLKKISLKKREIENDTEGKRQRTVLDDIHQCGSHEGGLVQW